MELEADADANAPSPFHLLSKCFGCYLNFDWTHLRVIRHDHKGRFVGRKGKQTIYVSAIHRFRLNSLRQYSPIRVRQSCCNTLS